LGHLEFSQAIIRAFRRAEIPLVFSQGFHPLPRVAFGPPLPVGTESWAEYLDFHVQGKFWPEEGLVRLNQVLFPGVEILAIQEIPLKSPSIFDNIITILYNISLNEPSALREEKISRFEKAEAFPVLWTRKNKNIDLKKYLLSVNLVEEHSLRLHLRFGPEGNLRPEEALGFIMGWTEQEKPALPIQKIQVFFKDSEPCPAKS
jgi:radical SAM-linked protein